MPLPLARLGVVRVFQEPVLETFLLEAFVGAKYTGQQTHAGVNQHKRREFAA